MSYSAGRDEFFTTGQIAEYCGVSFRTVLRWIQKGLLKAYRLPGRGDHRVHRDDFVQFAQEHGLQLSGAFGAHSKRALIVDDDLRVARSIERILRSAGFETEIVTDGFQAGYALNRVKPDLVTLDLRMKDLDGFGVLSYIRGAAELSSLKVLVVSGDSKDNLGRALKAGASGALTKPFTRAELLEKVDSILSVRPASPANRA